MKFQNYILINFVTEARTDARTDGQDKSNMPLQLFQSWGHKMDKGKILSFKNCDILVFAFRQVIFGLLIKSIIS